MRRVTNIFLMVFVLFGIEMSAHGSEKASLPTEVPFKKAADPAGNNKAKNTYSYRISGQITSGRISEISFHIAGFIDETLKKPGALVKKGEPLVTLEKDDYELSLEVAKIKKKQAQIQLQTAKAEFEREKELHAQNASTGSSFDQIKSQFEQAQINLKLATVQLQQADRQYQNTTLVAPYDCIVAESFKETGEHVGVGKGVMKIHEVSSNEVELKFPEKLVGKVEVGSTLTVSVPSVGFTGDAEIIRVVPIVSNSTRTFSVVAKIKGDDKRVVPGLFAEAVVN